MTTSSTRPGFARARRGVSHRATAPNSGADTDDRAPWRLPPVL
jgi:hypothetical protein